MDQQEVKQTMELKIHNPPWTKTRQCKLLAFICIMSFISLILGSVAVSKLKNISFNSASKNSVYTSKQTVQVGDGYATRFAALGNHEYVPDPDGQVASVQLGRYSDSIARLIMGLYEKRDADSVRFYFRKPQDNDEFPPAVTFEYEYGKVLPARVGVNTETPGATLHIVGDAIITGNLSVGGNTDKRIIMMSDIDSILESKVRRRSMEAKAMNISVFVDLKSMNNFLYVSGFTDIIFDSHGIVAEQGGYFTISENGYYHLFLQTEWNTTGKDQTKIVKITDQYDTLLVAQSTMCQLTRKCFINCANVVYLDKGTRLYPSVWSDRPGYVRVEMTLRRID